MSRPIKWATAKGAVVSGASATQIDERPPRLIAWALNAVSPLAAASLMSLSPAGKAEISPTRGAAWSEAGDERPRRQRSAPLGRSANQVGAAVALSALAVLRGRGALSETIAAASRIRRRIAAASGAKQLS